MSEAQPATAAASPAEPDLRSYLRMLRAHWLGVLLIVAASVATAFGYTLLQPSIYTADASAIVRTANDGDDMGAALTGSTIAQQKVPTYLDLGASRSVAARVIDELGLTTAPESLVRRIELESPADTATLRVQASARSPQEARDLAEAWVRALEQEVNQLESGDPAVQGVVYLNPVDSARLPSAPSSPNLRLNLGVGALVGLALATVYALLRHVLDRRIRNVEGVERETGVSVVGTIPEERSFTADRRLIPFDGGTSTTSAHAHLFAVAEAMRELRTNIRFMDVDRPPRVLTVTSPLPGDGKSTTAANLAITLAASGEPVVLIDGDLRRPMVGTIFALEQAAGLTDVLAGRASFDDLAHEVGRGGSLRVLPAGKVPPNPSEVLGSNRMRELLAAISQHATVIVDAPPLVPVTDAAVLSASTDGAVVVVSVGKTTFEVLDRALGNLRRAGARPLGVVLNRVPRRGPGAAYYGYQYHGEYYRAEEAVPPVEDGAGAAQDARALKPVAARESVAARHQPPSRRLLRSRARGIGPQRRP